MKILLVEDDQATRVLIEKALTAYYKVEIAADGRSALGLVEQVDYDLLVLDIGIPQLDGISVCQQLRTQGYQLPILLLTAKDQAGDRVLGLDAGADDYMTKPFHITEFLARVRALLRRSRTAVPSLVTWGSLRLDCLNQEIHYGEQPLRLTPKEYGILELLLLNPQRIFSRAVILDRLWELDEPPTESAISSHIKAIRQKLKAAGATQDFIETVYGFGYRLRSIETATALQKLDEKRRDPEEDQASGEAIVPETAEAVMAELWERFKDSFSTQLDLLDQVTGALLNGMLTIELQQEAKQTVHKLVGSLGVYGFPQGSVLAKQIEDLLRVERSLEAAEIQQLVVWVGALKQELRQKPIVTSVSQPSESQRPLVLVVDDDEALTERLQAEAHRRSLHLMIVADPIAAQATLERTLPDVILLDLTFSDGHEDGLNWLQTLKEQHPNLPVLVFTGRDSLSDRLAVSRLGAEQFLHKPVTTEQVFQAIARAITKPTPSKAKVFIVDDDPGVLAFLSEILTPWGLEVVTLSNPQRFWEVLVAASPDLILLDLEMPQVSGLELCQVVRQDIQWGNLPILVVTAHTDVDSLQQAFAAGADDFITKPVLGPDLVTRVLNRIDCTRLYPRLGNANSATQRANEP